MLATTTQRAEMAHLVPQLPLALRYPPEQRLDTYQQAPAGLLQQLQALTDGHADAVAGETMFLHGGQSSGKTHLLVAACAAAGTAGDKPAYLPLRRLRGRLAGACDGLETAALVAVDDVDAIAGQREDEVALFHLHNRLRDGGRVLLYAASMPPDAMPLVLPDLRSRLAQCSRWQLPQLDDAGRADLLRQRASARGLEFDDSALEWLLRRFSRNLGNLSELFERIDHAALAAQRRLTVPFLRQVLGADHR